MRCLAQQQPILKSNRWTYIIWLGFIICVCREKKRRTCNGLVGEIGMRRCSIKVDTHCRMC